MAKRCKNCKKPFTPKFFNQKFCLALECIKAFSEDVKKKQKDKERKELKTRRDALEPLSVHIKRTQTIVNRYIRLRDAGKNCISCKRPLGKVFDAGHYWSSKYKSTTFGGPYNMNLNGQCKQCNREGRGELILYRQGLIDRYGAEKLAELDKEARLTKKWTREELKDIREYFKLKIKALQI